MKEKIFLVKHTTTSKTNVPGKKLGEREALTLLSCTQFCLESSGGCEKERGVVRVMAPGHSHNVH